VGRARARRVARRHTSLRAPAGRVNLAGHCALLVLRRHAPLLEFPHRLRPIRHHTPDAAYARPA
jgi:hypothetical protein